MVAQGDGVHSDHSGDDGCNTITTTTTTTTSTATTNFTCGETCEHRTGKVCKAFCDTMEHCWNQCGDESCKNEYYEWFNCEGVEHDCTCCEESPTENPTTSPTGQPTKVS